MSAEAADRLRAAALAVVTGPTGGRTQELTTTRTNPATAHADPPAPATADTATAAPPAPPPTPQPAGPPLPSPAGEAAATNRAPARLGAHPAGPTAALLAAAAAVLTVTAPIAPPASTTAPSAALTAAPSAPSAAPAAHTAARPTCRPLRRCDPVTAAARLRAAASAVTGIDSAGAAGSAVATHDSPPRRAAVERAGAGSSSTMNDPIMAAARRAPASSTDGSDSDDDASSSTSDSRDSRFSTECVGCDRHIARDDGGNSCDVLGCRATRCAACMPVAEPYLCRQHGDVLGASAAAAAAAAAAGASAGTVTHAADGAAAVATSGPPRLAPAILVRALPGALTTAAGTGVAAALASLGDAWRSDPDMRDLADDLTETLSWGNASTRAKGAGAIRRLTECLQVLPHMLTQAVATPDIVDVLLCAYVSGRLRVRTARRRVPPEWLGRPIPEPTSVRGEVMALVGLLRLAAILPPDPRGSLLRLRRVLKKTGCLARHGASPRGYTFLWELGLAWDSGIVPRDNPQAVAALTLYVTGIHFLLRPIYVRSVEPTELTHVESTRYKLKWKWADKARAELLAAQRCGFHPGAAAAARSTGAAVREPEVAAAGPNGKVPAKHPRITGSQGKLLHELQQLWRVVRGSDDGPLFCRIEPARQIGRTPPGAVLTHWEHRGERTPAYMWTRSRMSEKILKQWLVRFLTPIVGPARAQKRVLSGLRGGGEMELVELSAPVSVRATVGWWVAKRLSAEGALVTYEGCSMESMWAWTALIGTLRLRVLAPGVFTHVPHPAIFSRGSRLRTAVRRETREAQREAERMATAAAARAPAHAAPRLAAASAAGARAMT